MNVRRFTARSSREALSLVREALGDDAVVLSTRPCADGVEILAMAPDAMAQVERLTLPTVASTANAAPPASAAKGLSAKGVAAKHGARDASTAGNGVADDVATLSMSTLSFQDYVRERLLKRRRAALTNDARLDAPVAAGAVAPAAPMVAPAVAPSATSIAASNAERAAAPVGKPITSAFARPIAQPFTPPFAEPSTDPFGEPFDDSAVDRNRVLEQRMAERRAAPARPTRAREEPMHRAGPIELPPADAGSARRDQDMMNELRQVKGLIEERFGALAFIDKLQRQPAQARLTQKLLDCGFSPALIRKLGDGLPNDIADESAWAAAVLERNLLTAEAEPALEDQGGVYALVGATGVGKTTTTAKIAAAFATQYGAANLGLITLDAYRVGAHEQLRAYGRILGVPVHTAHDRASLEDLLELLTAKKMVLVDTAGMAQRDTRTRELLEMLSHRAIQKLLVVNAASQGETIEDVLTAYRAASCAGVVLSKLDEAVKLGPALDALIRHKLKLLGVANGQRVPEDWHRLSAHALVHRALRGGGSSAYRLDASDVSLIFTAPHGGPQPAALHA